MVGIGQGSREAISGEIGVDKFMVEPAGLTDKLGGGLRQRKKSKMTPAF